MKRLVALVAVVFLMAGCSGRDDALNQAMVLRAKLLGSGGCSFQAKVTADYSDQVHTFTMDCQTDLKGDMSFSMVEPDSVAGIQGVISGEEGKLTFDDTVLAFPLLADGQLSPVSGPWIFIQTLYSGNVKFCGMDGDMIRVAIDDSFEDDALRLEVWLNGDNLPVHGEILYRERRILTIVIDNFKIL